MVNLHTRFCTCSLTRPIASSIYIKPSIIFDSRCIAAGCSFCITPFAVHELKAIWVYTVVFTFSPMPPFICYSSARTVFCMNEDFNMLVTLRICLNYKRFVRNQNFFTCLIYLAGVHIRPNHHVLAFDLDCHIRNQTRLVSCIGTLYILDPLHMLSQLSLCCPELSFQTQKNRYQVGMYMASLKSVIECRYVII